MFITQEFENRRTQEFEKREDKSSKDIDNVVGLSRKILSSNEHEMEEAEGDNRAYTIAHTENVKFMRNGLNHWVELS